MANKHPLIWCSKEEGAICTFAQALQPSSNRDFMDQYLIGTIEPERVARMIHHNNIFHEGNTGDQMAEFCRIIDDRKQWDMIYNKPKVLIQIRNYLVEIQNSSAPGSIADQTQIYPAVQTPHGSTPFVTNFQLQQQLYQDSDYGYHSRNAQNEFSLKLDDFILKTRIPGELPIFTISNTGYNHQHPRSDVLITEVIPPPPNGH